MACGILSVDAQVATDTLGGEVTYRTSQNIYVKFQSTKQISIGDTLFLTKDGTIIPALIVNNLSSTSCVGTPLTDLPIEAGTRIIARVQQKPKELRGDTSAISTPLSTQIEDAMNKPLTEKEEEKVLTEKSETKGRISAAAYINFAENPEANKQRMRYTLTANSRRIGQTGLSAEVYMSFRHTLDEWQEVQDNFKERLRYIPRA